VVGFLGVATGLIIGRWWLLLLVPPAVYIWMFYFEWSILEEHIQRGIFARIRCSFGGRRRRGDTAPPFRQSFRQALLDDDAS
jgi:hypothetical protein